MTNRIAKFTFRNVRYHVWLNRDNAVMGVPSHILPDAPHPWDVAPDLVAAGLARYRHYGPNTYGHMDLILENKLLEEGGAE